ncbi:MAG TPA: TRAM domain-containing protein [Dermatophilaceae bacterium]|nr:TRAM domain-containing protein [Dermatophilaceae bacterium]
MPTTRPADRPAADALPVPQDSLVGSRFEMTVGPVAHGGHCVGRLDGRVVFVRHALPGEVVTVGVTRGRSADRFLFADAVQVHSPSPHRVNPPCRYAGPGGCGGCDFQHVDLDEQRRWKGGVITEQLARLAGLHVPVLVEPVPGDDHGLRWRTRVQFAVDRHGAAGLHPHHCRTVLPIEDCLIARQEVSAEILRRRYPGSSAVEVALSSAGERSVVVLPQGRRRTERIHETVRVGPDSWTFRLNAASFWQVHPGLAAVLVDAVRSGLRPRPGERALDLYSGVGVFARALADAVGPDGAVLAVEADPRAVRAAQEWATGETGGDHVVQVRAGRVEATLRGLVAGGDRVDLVVLDPPRAGSGRAVVADLTALRPRAICYVACDPAALARDTADLVAAGYTLADLRAFDAFPMTQHVECVAVFTDTPDRQARTSRPAGPPPSDRDGAAPRH